MSQDGGTADRVRRLRRRFRPRTRPRVQGQSFNRLIPNIMTMLGLCCGLVAIRFGFEQRYEQAATLILVAMVIDGLDGRLARLLKATSRFGAEFDSLSDFLCFGVAPAMLLYLWTMHDFRSLGFAPCLLFAVCMALRLARFNAALDVGPSVKPAYTYSFFTGVPAPAGAGCVLFPMFLWLWFDQMEWSTLAAAIRHPIFVGPVMVLVAGLLVSTLPTWSFKNFRVPREYVLPLLLGTGMFVAVLLAEPWAALAFASLCYLAMLPFSIRSYLRLKREAESLIEPMVVTDNTRNGAG